MSANNELTEGQINALYLEHRFSIEKDGCEFHFGIEEGNPYLVGASFLFSAEFGDVDMHLAGSSHTGYQVTEDYELGEDYNGNVYVKYANKVIMYQLEAYEIDRGARRYEDASGSGWWEGLTVAGEPFTGSKFEPTLNPTQDWLKRASMSLQTAAK